MRALFINEEAKTRAAELKKFADSRRFTLADLMRRMQQRDIPGNDPNYTMFLDDGWKVVYTIEQLPQVGWCRHISVSVDVRDTKHPMPSVSGVEMILKDLFGLNLMEASAIQKEPVPDGGVAVNMIFKHKDL